MKNLAFLTLIAAIFCLVGCNPRQLPGFKQAGKLQEERITRETDEAIKTSSALQQLDRLCTQEIPRPEGFLSMNKFKNLNGETFLGYGYHSALDYQSVKHFYVNYFAQHGWQVTKQKDGGWGPSKIEFRKDTNKVTISESGYDGEGINYFVECAQLSP